MEDDSASLLNNSLSDPSPAQKSIWIELKNLFRLAHESNVPLAPGSSWFFGSYWELWENGPEAFRKATVAHGGLVRIRGIFRHYHVVADPKLFRIILKDSHRHFGRGLGGPEELQPYLGDGMLTTTGPEWRQHRLDAAPAFRLKSLAELPAIVEELCKQWIATYKGKIEPLSPELLKLTLKISNLYFFGQRTDDQQIRKLVDDLGFMQSYVYRQMFFQQVNFIKYLPIPWNFKGRRGYRRIERHALELIREEIQRQKAQPETPPAATYLAGLVAKYLRPDENLAPLKKCPFHAEKESSLRLLRDQTMTMLLAAPENPAHTLAWFFYELGKRPDYQDLIFEEIRQAVPDRPATDRDLPKLPALTRFMNETFRFYPGGWAFERQTLEDTDLDGFFVPKGTVLILSPYAMHHNPRIWKDPETFDPDRFRPERIGERAQGSFLPFGLGPQTCIGLHFAQIIIQLIAIHVIRNFKIRSPEQDASFRAAFNLRPKTGLRIDLEAR